MRLVFLKRGCAALIVAASVARVSSAPAAPPADSAQAHAADSAHAAPAHVASPHGHSSMTTPHGSPGKPFKIVVPSGAPRVTTVTLGVRHRVFHDFVESDEVQMKERFAIGDTPYSATVTDFLPDFVIDVAARRITSRSNEPKNPAFRIVVRENGVVSDTTWAFLNLPPHFAPKSMLAFKIMRIDFTDRPPLLADTSAAGKSGQ